VTAKRVVDVILAAVALVAAAPVLAVAAVGIRLAGPGPILYRAQRVGLHTRVFTMFKLRTMRPGQAYPSAITAKNDPRVFPFGALLRRTKVDELPQLYNVLRGDMAIVGPRPTVPVQVDRYTERQRGRLAVKPGITGWAQVNGRTELPWDERIELDLWYIEHRSWRLDLRILLLTVRMVFGGQGLYRGEAPAWRDPPGDA
jgi:lipopolysaccharide/colanic/teichoic acid biosynthesis glycosyltransferase